MTQRPKSLAGRRQGMAIVIVLALLALTLGFSYALMRNRTSDHELERNQARKADARTAAQAGMSVALRKLYDGSWAGADTNFAGSLSTDNLLGFTVTYTTGDSALASSSADWNEYPFRLTIDSKGYSIDPTTSSSRSEYTIRTVVQLVRRKLNTSQAASGLESLSICQSKNSEVRIQHPVRLNGYVYIQGEIEFSRSYPQGWRGTEYMKFFEDLYDMYDDKGWDYRTFGGTLLTPSSRQPLTGDVVQVLDAKLRVPRINVSTTSARPVPAISSFGGYRLYDKGKLYPGQSLTVTADSSDVVPSADYVVTPGTYAADPQTNPLGVFTAPQASIGFTSNTTLQGVVVSCASGTSSDVHIAGTNVSLQGKDLPTLNGDSTIYRLPVILAKDDVRVHDGTNRTINGWIVCGDGFQLMPGASSTTLTVNGGVFCDELYLDGRTSWVQSSSLWDSAYDSYDGGLLYNLLHGLLGIGHRDYFPGWLYDNRASWGIYLTPRLIFNATPDGVKNHVPDADQPIYVPHTDEGGLRWDVVRWQEIGA